jgi:hypothetical protein
MRSDEWDKKERRGNRMPRRGEPGAPHDHNYSLAGDRCVTCGKTREEVRKSW